MVAWLLFALQLPCFYMRRYPVTILAIVMLLSIIVKVQQMKINAKSMRKSLTSLSGSGRFPVVTQKNLSFYMPIRYDTLQERTYLQFVNKIAPVKHRGQTSQHEMLELFKTTSSYQSGDRQSNYKN